MDAEEERQLLLGSRDRNGRSWALPSTVHDLFVQQAGQAPGRTAAIGPQGALTYGELLERSRALAGRLQSVLARPLDRPVALLADADPLVLAGCSASSRREQVSFRSIRAIPATGSPGPSRTPPARC